MSETLFEVKGLMSGYGDVQVLWGIDLKVRKKEITCIVGSNGAGKSTLLRTLSGLLPTRAGMVTFNGRDLTGCTSAEALSAGIAHVPEGRRLFKGLSVRDNLLLGAYHRKASRVEIENDLDQIYHFFPILKDRRHQDATTMSGGEQQMCAIGRGIMSRPSLLMIDELSLGLAPLAVESLCSALRSINQTGLSILLVEQDVFTAFELATSAFVVESGRVSLEGSCETLALNPQVRQAYMGI